MPPTDASTATGRASPTTRSAACARKPPHPGDPDLADLVDELASHSEEFTGRWDAHDVEYHRSGRQRFRHPEAGDPDFDYDALEVPADPGLTLVTCTAAPASPHAAALARLAGGTSDVHGSGG
ncbi:MmyB family transcriptional regulator [Streptomyces bungoensis]